MVRTRAKTHKMRENIGGLSSAWKQSLPFRIGRDPNQKLLRTVSGSSARSAGGTIDANDPISYQPRPNRGVGAKRPPRGGGSGAAQLCWANAVQYRFNDLPSVAEKSLTKS